jgi:hypothetical protein
LVSILLAWICFRGLYSNSISLEESLPQIAAITKPYLAKISPTMNTNTLAKTVVQPVQEPTLMSPPSKTPTSSRALKEAKFEPKASTSGFDIIKGMDSYLDTSDTVLSAHKIIDFGPNAVYSATTFPPKMPHEKKWHLDGWVVFRPSEIVGNGPANGQLSGSQFGARLQHSLTSVAKSASLNVNIRASAPLDHAAGKEVALGLALNVRGKIPVDLILERRIPIGTGTPAFAAILATGLNDVHILKKAILNGYLQTGFVADSRIEPFVDGSFTATRIVRLNSRRSIQVGVGIWGAAQSGISRLDIGPVVAGRVPVRGGTFRLAAEWRQRLAGNALPASGPAISISADF